MGFSCFILSPFFFNDTNLIYYLFFTMLIFVNSHPFHGLILFITSEEGGRRENISNT